MMHKVDGAKFNFVENAFVGGLKFMRVFSLESFPAVRYDIVEIEYMTWHLSLHHARELHKN